MFSLELTGVDDIIKGKLNYAKMFAVRGAQRGIEFTYDKIIEGANQKVGYDLHNPNRPGGETIQSHWHKVSAHENMPNTVTGYLYNDAKHAAYVEFGTGDKANLGNVQLAGTPTKGTSAGAAINESGKSIFPIGIKPLRFVYDGKWITTLGVQGQPPKNYLWNTLMESKQSIKNEIGYYIWVDLTNLGV